MAPGILVILSLGNGLSPIQRRAKPVTYEILSIALKVKFESKYKEFSLQQNVLGKYGGNFVHAPVCEICISGR